MTARGYGSGPRTRITEARHTARERLTLALGIALCAVARGHDRPRPRRVLLLPHRRPRHGRRGRRRGGRHPRRASAGRAWCCADDPRHGPRPAVHVRGAPAPALECIDLDVAAREVLLLEGPSGEGKSTLLRALCGLVPHFHGGRFSGTVTVAGHDTLRTHPARICRLAGMVFQDPEGQAVLGSVDRDVAFGLESAGLEPRAIPGARGDGARDGGGAAPAWTRHRIAVGRRAPAGGPRVGTRAGSAAGAARRAHLPARRRGGRRADGHTARARARRRRGRRHERAPRRPHPRGGRPDRGGAWRSPGGSRRRGPCPVARAPGPDPGALARAAGGHTRRPPRTPRAARRLARPPRRRGHHHPGPERLRQDDAAAGARGAAPAGGGAGRTGG